MAIKGRLHLITGSARGIGLAVAEAILLRDGYVCLSDVLVDEGEAVKRTLSSRFGEDRVMFSR